MQGPFTRFLSAFHSVLECFSSQKRYRGVNVTQQVSESPNFSNLARLLAGCLAALGILSFDTTRRGSVSINILANLSGSLFRVPPGRQVNQDRLLGLGQLTPCHNDGAEVARPESEPGARDGRRYWSTCESPCFRRKCDVWVPISWSGSLASPSESPLPALLD